MQAGKIPKINKRAGCKDHAGWNFQKIIICAERLFNTLEYGPE